MREYRGIIIAGVLLGILFWVLDTVIDYSFFYQKSFAEVLITDVSSLEVYIRVLLFMFFGLFGVGLAIVMKKRRKADNEVESAKTFLDNVIDFAPFAMWVSDSEGTVIRTNNSLRKTLHLTNEQIVGKYNVLEDRNLEIQGVMPMVRDIFEKYKPARFDVPWKAAEAGEVDFSGGRDLFIDVSMFPILDAKGNLANVVCQWVDITERREAEEALRQSEERFKQVAEAAEEWIWEVDADGLYTYASEAVFRILGYKPEEIVGKKHFSDLFAPDRKDDMRRWAFETFARRESFNRFENANIHKDGRVVILETSGSPIVGGSGNLEGYIGADTDITKRKEDEQRLRESEHALSKSQEVAHIGSWELDILNDRLTWSKEVYLIFGVPLDSEMTYGRFMEIVYAGDRDYVDTRWREAIGGTGFDIEHRIVVDGEIKWVHEKAIVDFDDRENAVRGIGTVQDITARKLVEEELEKHRERLEEMVREKTQELNARVAELERYRDATVEREIRMKELRDRIEELETQSSD